MPAAKSPSPACDPFHVPCVKPAKTTDPSPYPATDISAASLLRLRTNVWHTGQWTMKRDAIKVISEEVELVCLWVGLRLRFTNGFVGSFSGA